MRDRMLRIDLPERLETTIFDYYEYLYSRFRLVDDKFDNFLSELPEHIHLNVKWCMHGETLKAVYLFQDCTEFFVMQASAIVLRELCCDCDARVVMHADRTASVTTVPALPPSTAPA